MKNMNERQEGWKGMMVPAYAQKKSQKEKNLVCGKEAIFKVLMADAFPKWKIGVLTLMSSNQNKWKEIRITEYHNKVGEPQKTQGVSKATWDKKTSDNQTNRKNEKQYLHCHEFDWLNGEGT